MKTKQEFITTAQILKDSRLAIKQGSTIEDVLQYIENRFTFIYRASNPKFDEQKFRKACK